MTQPPAGPPYPPQPPPAGEYPPAAGQYPPPPGQYPPPAGQYPPPAGQYPPPAGQYPPPAGQYPPPYPPPPASYPPQAPGYYQQPAPQAQTTSGFAIASLIFGVIGGVLLSVIFGIIALGKTKAGGQRGRGMAIAGLVLSLLWTIGITVAIVAAVMAPTHSVSALNVKLGDCLADLPSGSTVSRVNTTSCDRPHSAEVAGVLKMPDGSFPSESVFTDYKQKCRDALASYSSTAMEDPNVDLAVMPPSQDSWKHGDRDMVCIATFSTQRTGSIKG